MAYTDALKDFIREVLREELPGAMTDLLQGSLKMVPKRTPTRKNGPQHPPPATVLVEPVQRGRRKRLSDSQRKSNAAEYQRLYRQRKKAEQLARKHP